MKIFAIGMNYAAHNKELHDTLLKPELARFATQRTEPVISSGYVKVLDFRDTDQTQTENGSQSGLPFLRVRHGFSLFAICDF